MALNVFRENMKIGSLDMSANEHFYGFTYDAEYLDSPTALPISLSLPLSDCRYSGDQAQPYFEGLLPEGEARAAISRRLGIPEASSVKLLRALGRDCAGDITIIDDSEYPEVGNVHNNGTFTQMHLPLDGGILAVAKSPHEEITHLQENMRLSLAGGQKKIALYHKKGELIQSDWYVPILGSPTTHIIKPGILDTHYPHMTLNEFLCIRAAAACGIPTVTADLLFPETPVIAISRYDRLVNDTTINGLPTVTRLHQEDFCQACGVKSAMKYEHDGGPGFKMVRDLLVRHSKNPIDDATMLVKWGIFNYLIGNCDAHAKNISLLHNADGTVSLAPTYDLISTAVYDGSYGAKLSRNMGMRIGLHENIDKVNSDDIRIFARDVHMRPQQIKSLFEETIEQLPTAFCTAAAEAESIGFSHASEMVDRILNGCDKRKLIFYGFAMQ